MLELLRGWPFVPLALFTLAVALPDYLHPASATAAAAAAAGSSGAEREAWEADVLSEALYALLRHAFDVAQLRLVPQVPASSPVDVQRRLLESLEATMLPVRTKRGAAVRCEKRAAAVCKAPCTARQPPTPPAPPHCCPPPPPPPSCVSHREESCAVRGWEQDDARMIMDALRRITCSHAQETHPAAAVPDRSVLADEVRLMYLEATGVDALACR
jgi:hypothetical protein